MLAEAVLNELPSPLEVIRFISVETLKQKTDKIELPSPLEVIRFISENKYIGNNKKVNQFPSPLEVNRFISADEGNFVNDFTRKFPSPLEVNRFISELDDVDTKCLMVSVPSRGK